MTIATAALRKCPREHCYAPDVACVMGDDLPDCAQYAGQAPEPGSDERLAPSDYVERLPWSGLGLGSDDVAAVAAIGRPVVVALVGAASAGKTTALAATFVAMRRGGSLGGGSFAGSFTLLGWQIMSSYMLWPPHGDGGFPPHTTAVDARSPSLLHIRLRDEVSGVVREVLVSDMPGEWFSAWAIDENDGVGASWLAEHADSFVLFADSEALASPRRGASRAAYEALARRVHSAAMGRPVLPVLSKADIRIPEAVLGRIARVNASLFTTNALPVSARTVDAPALAAVDKAVHLAMRSRSHAYGPHAYEAKASPAAQPKGDPVLAYRSPVLSARLGGADG